ncbi:MAG: HlyD family efflux transporter periplasmic adaptor subunit [Calditrichaceae bacterium]
MSTGISFTGICILIQLSLSGCGSQANQNPDQKLIVQDMNLIADSVDIHHEYRQVYIPFEGMTEAFEHRIIYSADSSNVIALLVEQGKKVNQNDFLAGLWSLSKQKEYTPIDIRSPMTGEITKVFIKVGDNIGPGTPLFEIRNNDYQILKVPLSYEQARYIYKGQRAELKTDSVKVQGIVNRVDNSQGLITILINNIEAGMGEETRVKGMIDVGKIKGEYIESRYFDASGKLLSTGDGGETLEILKIGTADTLSLISPPLPHSSKVHIIQKSLDLAN